MNISPEIAISIICLVASIGGAWGVSSRRLDDEAEKNKNYANQFEKLWAWKDSHEMFATETRLGIMKEIAAMDAKFATRDAQFNEIMRTLVDMKDSIVLIRGDVTSWMTKNGGS